MKKIISPVIILFIFFHCAPRDRYLVDMAKTGNVNIDAPLVESVSAEINAPAEDVWKIIINVGEWMKWNKAMRAVRSNGVTFLGDKFAWNMDKKTFSTVTIFEPSKRLVWYSKASAYKSIMKWEIVKLSNNRCKVILQESRDGFLMNIKSSINLVRELSNWVNSLKFEAETVIM